jgi:rhamnose transport system ATP-binding protein
VTVPELVRLMANRDRAALEVRVERGAELLRVDGPVRGVLTDISFTLHAGGSSASGPPRRGRTELARVVAGADRFDAGRLLVDGQEMRFAILPMRSRAASACRGPQGAGAVPA